VKEISCNSQQNHFGRKNMYLVSGAKHSNGGNARTTT